MATQFLSNDFFQSSVNLVTPTIAAQFSGNFHGRTRSQERVKNSLAMKAEEFDQTFRNLFRERRNALLESESERENIGDVPYCQMPFITVVVL